MVGGVKEEVERVNGGLWEKEARYLASWRVEELLPRENEA